MRKSIVLVALGAILGAAAGRFLIAPAVVAASGTGPRYPTRGFRLPVPAKAVKNVQVDSGLFYVTAHLGSRLRVYQFDGAADAGGAPTVVYDIRGTQEESEGGEEE